MRFDILTLFPEIITPYQQASIMGRAQTAGHITVHAHDIRAYAPDKHRTTDDTPYGGGAGMVLKVEPIDRALQALNTHVPRDQQRVIVLAARGHAWTQAHAQHLAESGKSITLICGRYEGVDQRVADHLADEEISIGPYVLAGGELAALVLVETIARLIPGVLGNPDSLIEESHTQPRTTTRSIAHNASPAEASERRREYPQYTKPEVYNGWPVPPVLLSGNHAAIRAWRQEQT